MAASSSKPKTLQHYKPGTNDISGSMSRAREAATEAFRILEEKAEHVVVHFDADVIDGTELPATDIPHSGGLSFRDTAEALQVFLSSPRTAGLVVTEFNPSRDGDGSQARRLLDKIVRTIRPPLESEIPPRYGRPAVNMIG